MCNTLMVRLRGTGNKMNDLDISSNTICFKDQTVNDTRNLADSSSSSGDIQIKCDHFKQCLVTPLSRYSRLTAEPKKPIDVKKSLAVKDLDIKNNICFKDDHFKHRCDINVCTEQNSIKTLPGNGTVISSVQGVNAETRPTVSEKPTINPDSDTVRCLNLPLYQKNRILSQSLTSPSTCKRLLTVEVIKDDIAKDGCHAIVNPVNTKLQHQKGVGSHIMKIAGSDVSKELKDCLPKTNEVPVTTVIVTRPGSLRCRHVFHAVGPRWRDYRNKSQCRHDLSMTLLKCLIEAYRRKLTSIALPAISAGNNRVPIQDCAQSYIRALKVFEWKVSRGSLRLVRFVDTDSKVIDAIRQELDAEWDKPYDFVGIDPWHNIIDIITSGRDTTCATSNIQELSTSDKGLLRLPEPKLDDSICSSNVISVVDGGRDDEDDTENIGPMPPGTMKHFVARGQLPGYKQNEHIVINYTFEEGVQLASHPKPGRKYNGSQLCSYLPHTPEGFAVLELLQRAFSRKLLFTVARENINSEHYIVTWGCISQKRNKDGGRIKYGYPDPDYFKRVRTELARFGIHSSS